MMRIADGIHVVVSPTTTTTTATTTTIILMIMVVLLSPRLFLYWRWKKKTGDCSRRSRRRTNGMMDCHCCRQGIMYPIFHYICVGSSCVILILLLLLRFIMFHC